MTIQHNLKQWLNNHPEIELAILFGSYAKNTANRHSDVDLAIQLASGQPMAPQDKIDYITELLHRLNLNIDLVDLNTVGQPLLSEIMKYGLRLTGSKALYSALAIKNINSAQDFMPAIERMLKIRRKRWLQHG